MMIICAEIFNCKLKMNNGKWGTLIQKLIDYITGTNNYNFTLCLGIRIQPMFAIVRVIRGDK